MRNLQNTYKKRYTHRFLNHLWAFCVKHKLINSRDVVIALSGGVDSMVLLWCMNEFFKIGLINKKPRAIMIDHGTRVEIENEVKEVKKFCQNLEINISIYKISNLSLHTSNFENTARDFRYEKLLKAISENEVILFAHHLDDCFEWSLMQKLKSSNLKSQLGMPLKRGVIRRPFFCVSKDQILKLAKIESIPYFDDASNEDIRFERNFVRKILVEKIKTRYPKYLKHYVASQNQLLSLVNEKRLQTNDTQSFSLHQRSWGKILRFENNKLQNQKINIDSLRDIILSCSEVGRGQIHKQLENLWQNLCVKNKANTITGPYQFSGGVHVFHIKGYLLIVRKGQKPYLYISQIPELIPFITRLKKSEFKASFPPFNEQIQVLIDGKMSFGLVSQGLEEELSADNILFYI